MSIRKRKGRYHPVCDCCLRELAPEYSYEDCLSAMWIAGWHYDHKSKTNTCPECTAYLKGFEEDKDVQT